MSTVNEEVVLREVGRRIAKLRSRHGMTQEELAERLGVSRSRLSHWERGSNPPSLTQLIDLREALQTSLDVLIPGGIPDQLADPAFSSAQLERMARHLKGLSEIVTAEQKRRRGARRSQTAAGESDAGPLANSGKGLNKEAV